MLQTQGKFSRLWSALMGKEEELCFLARGRGSVSGSAWHWPTQQRGEEMKCGGYITSTICDAKTQPEHKVALAGQAKTQAKSRAADALQSSCRDPS